MFSRLVLIFPLLLLVFLFSCNRKDKRAAVITEVEKMYLDYQVLAQEGDDKLTVLIRFRDGEEGDAILLPPDAEILLDGLLLKADSSKRTGGFYEVHLPIDSFQGTHHFLLKQGGKLVHDQPFSFSKMGLVEEPADSLSRGELVFRFTGLGKEDYVRVIATDTVFYSEGINRLDTIRNNQLLLNRNDLALLENGPVQLVFSREWEQPLDGSGKPEGKLSINYTLRREFFLKD